MARPFIEFVQSQWLPWEQGVLPGRRSELQVKRLSVDADDGAATLLVRYPPGWSSAAAEPLSVDEECFVLRGVLMQGEERLGLHDYSYRPAGHSVVIQTGSQGAVVLTCFDGRPAPLDPASAAARYDPTGSVPRLHTMSLPWDRTNMDPHIAHLNAWRKNLRRDPAGRGRTYLLAGLPQGYPADGAEPLERHPHVEEMFMISGDMPCSRGIMRAGAYFWRPPHIWHGADCTLGGFLLFMRTPGSNETISEWATEPTPVTFEPAHAPILPSEWMALGARPQPDPVEY